jgi:hypothetical protein
MQLRTGIIALIGTLAIFVLSSTPAAARHKRGAVVMPMPDPHVPPSVYYCPPTWHPGPAHYCRPVWHPWTGSIACPPGQVPPIVDLVPIGPAPSPIERLPAPKEIEELGKPKSLEEKRPQL